MQGGDAEQTVPLADCPKPVYRAQNSRKKPPDFIPNDYHLDVLEWDLHHACGANKPSLLIWCCRVNREVAIRRFSLLDSNQSLDSPRHHRGTLKVSGPFALFPPFLNPHANIENWKSLRNVGTRIPENNYQTGITVGCGGMGTCFVHVRLTNLQQQCDSVKSIGKLLFTGFWVFRLSQASLFDPQRPLALCTL